MSSSLTVKVLYGFRVGESVEDAIYSATEGNEDDFWFDDLLKEYPLLDWEPLCVGDASYEFVVGTKTSVQEGYWQCIPLRVSPLNEPPKADEVEQLHAMWRALKMAGEPKLGWYVVPSYA